MVQQVEIEGFTRTGFRVVVRDTAKNGEEAKKILDAVGFMGLLPAPLEKPDEQQFGRVSHVALTHTEDGTPHVAFFNENAKLENRWTHKYLNSQAERDEFEAWSGLKLAGMKAQEDNAHPQRGKPSWAKYAVALPEIRALVRVTSYKRESENNQEVWKPENDVERYIISAKNETTAPVHWTEDLAQMKMVDAWIEGAKKENVDAYVEALAEIGKRESFPTRLAYLEALKAIATKKKQDAKKEQEAKGEDIPF